MAKRDEERRFKNIADMKDAIQTASMDDKDEAVYIRRLTKETFMRSASDRYLEYFGDAWANIRAK